MKADEKNYFAKKFGIKPDEIVWHNSGSCYDRIIVTTKSAANKVRAAVKGMTVNGGYMHGVPLGSINKVDNGYDVTC